MELARECLVDAAEEVGCDVLVKPMLEPNLSVVAGVATPCDWLLATGVAVDDASGWLILRSFFGVCRVLEFCFKFSGSAQLKGLSETGLVLEITPSFFGASVVFEGCFRFLGSETSAAESGG